MPCRRTRGSAAWRRAGPGAPAGVPPSRACRSAMGFQSCSRKTTVSAAVRLRPSPPTAVVSSMTSMVGSALKRCTLRERRGGGGPGGDTASSGGPFPACAPRHLQAGAAIRAGGGGCALGAPRAPPPAEALCRVHPAVDAQRGDAQRAQHRALHQVQQPPQLRKDEHAVAAAALRLLARRLLLLDARIAADACDGGGRGRHEVGRLRREPRRLEHGQGVQRGQGR